VVVRICNFSFTLGIWKRGYFCGDFGAGVVWEVQ